MNRRFRCRDCFGPTGLALLAVVALGLGGAGATGPAPRPDDDEDDRAEARQLAERAFAENCLMCHGSELTTRQRLTPKQWTAEVEKMIGWGTPLPPERKDGLIAFLSETYPVTRPATEPERITPEAAVAGDRQDAPAPASTVAMADPDRGAALFDRNCVACHGPEARGGAIGVNLVGKPVLTREDEFRRVLHQGRRRMPAFAAVLDDRAQLDLLAYLRQQSR